MARPSRYAKDALPIRHLSAFLAASLLAPAALLAEDRPLEGFGAVTTGGLGGEEYVVTTLEDEGPGSLQDAISEPNRYITFAVGGTIQQTRRLVFRDSNITIDASTAPAPGITLAGIGIDIAESGGHIAHDIIVKNIRVIDGTDNLAIAEDAHNIVIDHCSFRRASDGNVDMFTGAHDITLQYCIFGDNDLNVLIRTGVHNVSMHHNLFALGNERNPQVQDETQVVDLVNNVMYGWNTNYCTRFRGGGSGNVVKNAFLPGPSSDVLDALEIDGNAGPVYVLGNLIPEDNDTGTASERLSAPKVEELNALSAIVRVLAEAGTQPRDADDQRYVDEAAAAAPKTPAIAKSWGQLKERYGNR